MMPPSPSLSARRISATYFTETTRVTDQKISEITPNTSESVGLTAWPSIENTVCIAYSGLVPMSPKTIPIAPTASPIRPPLCAAGCAPRPALRVVLGRYLDISAVGRCGVGHTVSLPARPSEPSRHGERQVLRRPRVPRSMTRHADTTCSSHTLSDTPTYGVRSWFGDPARVAETTGNPVRSAQSKSGTAPQR